MIAVVIGFFLLAPQGTVVQVGPGGVAVQEIRDTAQARRDSVRRARRRLPATPAEVASAFEDPTARATFARAREARARQDSSITSYEANTVQRITTGLSVSRLGRERMMFRSESATRVRWKRGVGAHIEVTGKRAVAPIVDEPATFDIESALSPVPYFPGRDDLWFGSAANRDRELGDIVHPLGTGAETHYTFRTGDSVSFRLPDATQVQLRELLVQPRAPRWDRVVGSLWFDTRSGQLVRAAYRLSEPLDLFAQDTTDDTPALVRAALHPTSATMSGVAIEYGLHQGRFWLPRTQVAEGDFRAGFVRVPLRIEERFSYESVNADVDLVSLDSAPPRPVIDTTLLAGLSGTERRRVLDSLRTVRDSARRERREAQCAEGGVLRSAKRHDNTLPVLVRISCDTAALARSPALPASIFDDGDEVFGDTERDDLLARARAMMPDGAMALPIPTARWGLDLVRYNRIEGLSSAVEITMPIMPGFEIHGRPRIGVADRIVNFELALRHQRDRTRISVGGYRRLATANDWGDPLSFGAGASAFLFGRDDGMYYRATGAELVASHPVGEIALFAERQSDAIARTTRTLGTLFGGANGFDPAANITADAATLAGARTRMLRSFGRNVSGWRAFTDLRAEIGVGDFDYQRGALDITVNRPLVGRTQASVTVGGGTIGGSTPVQRLFYLGGFGSVRGQSAGALVGNTYWLSRLELGRGTGVRPVVFGDLGWAGDRADWTRIGRPASGVGVGVSFLDGLVRFDVARGIHPRQQTRVGLQLDTRF